VFLENNVPGILNHPAKYPGALLTVNSEAQVASPVSWFSILFVELHQFRITIPQVQFQKSLEIARSLNPPSGRNGASD
jgi:hypothetical protein